MRLTALALACLVAACGADDSGLEDCKPGWPHPPCAGSTVVMGRWPGHDRLLICAMFAEDYSTRWCSYYHSGLRAWATCGRNGAELIPPEHFDRDSGRFTSCSRYYVGNEQEDDQ